MFGITSGTTGKPKLIPITKSFVKKYKMDWDTWAYFAYKDHPDMFDGKLLVMVAPEISGYTKSGLPFGSISGLIAQHQSKAIRRFYSLPYSVHTMRDYDAKYYVILRLAMEQEIGTIITPNPSMVLILCNKIHEFKDEIIRDIEKGTLSKNHNIERHVREDIEKLLKPNKKRAFQLMKMENLLPSNIWKQLRLIGCWKEGTLPIFLRQFPKYFGKIASRDIGLISTEAQSSVPIGDTAKGGVLTVGSIFFEFLSVDERKKDTLLMWDLELNEDYYMIITTNNGLYRYFTNDIVRVISYYHKTPIIQFLHKGEHIASVTGEKLTEWQVVTAMRYASKHLDVPVGGFTACARMGKTPRYDILIELHEKCETRKLKKMIELFDDELKKLNIEYREKRDSERLNIPRLKIVHERDYSKLHRARTEAGAHDAQVKIPSLTDDPEFEKHFRIIKVVS